MNNSLQYIVLAIMWLIAFVTLSQVRVWASELAFVVSFGTLSVKVWRLYRIFFNKAMVEQAR